MEKNIEPTEEKIRLYMADHSGESYYTAREILREMVYREDHDKPDGISWGDYWKSY